MHYVTYIISLLIYIHPDRLVLEIKPGQWEIPFYQNHGGSFSIFQIPPELVAEGTWQPANT